MATDRQREDEIERLRKACALYRIAFEKNSDCCGCGAGMDEAKQADELAQPSDL
jgi:hypothetical protein